MMVVMPMVATVVAVVVIGVTKTTQPAGKDVTD
jgi:hypothetical protein